MTSLVFDHPNLIIIHFNQYAGGKFFINCLAHHARVLPGLGVSPEHDHNMWMVSDLPDSEKNQKKITKINKTLPPTDQTDQWSSYEMGCVYFWGGGIANFLDPMPPDVKDPSPTAISLMDRYYCFLVNHDIFDSRVSRIQQVWPRCRHIILHNTRKFQMHSAAFKSPDFLLNHQDLQQHVPGAFYLDVDETYFNESKIKESVRRCLTWLGLDHDLDPNMDHYIKRYLDLHQI